MHPSSHSITNAASWITANISPTHAGPDAKMNVVHACVIPSGPHRGEVLVFDGNLTNVGVRAYQPWAIVNPYWPNPNPFVPGSGVGYRFHNALEASPTLPQPVPVPPPPAALQGDFFCSGHRWLANGRLFLASGTKAYPINLPPSAPPNVFIGSQLVYQWDPVPQAALGYPFGRWYRMDDLAKERWYATVTTDGTSSDRVLILGGTNWPGSGTAMPEVNSYEAYVCPFFALTPSATPEHKIGGTTAPFRVYGGPSVTLPVPLAGTVPGFNNYPRILPVGVLDPIPSGGTAPRLFVCGYWSMGFRWAHDKDYDPAITNANAYNTGIASQGVFIDDGNCLLYPAAVGAVPSLVVRMGGGWQTTFSGTPANPDPVLASNVVESAVVTRSTSTSTTWSTGGPSDIPDMNVERYKGNIVILPTGQLFAIGGTNRSNDYNLEPEIYTAKSGWKPAASHDSPRDYHSTALLLPDGRVFVAGGEHRTWDYQIYEPEYLSVPAVQRPQGVSILNEFTLFPISQDATPGVAYGQSCVASLSAPLPAGVVIDAAVLMAPAALTHHDDGGQRCIRLLVNGADIGPILPSTHYNAVSITMPATEQHAPPGWYMLFLLTSAGVPSNAYWVNLR